MKRQTVAVVAALGTAQTLAWGSTYYLPAILAGPIAWDLGIPTTWFFAAFSGSLVISGLLGPRVGRQIDKVGGRQVLCVSNFVLAAGLAVLGASNSPVILALAWLLSVWASGSMMPPSAPWGGSTAAMLVPQSPASL